MRNRQTLDLYCGDSRVFLWENRLWPLHLLRRACLAFIVTVAEISISSGLRHLQKMRRPAHQCTESIIKASAGFGVWLPEMGLPYSDFNCVQHKIQIKLLLKCPGAKSHASWNLLTSSLAVVCLVSFLALEAMNGTALIIYVLSPQDISWWHSEKLHEN